MSFMKFNNIQSSQESINRGLIQIGVPQAGVKIAGDPKLLCAQRHVGTFGFHENWVAVDPSEYMRDTNGTAKFINDNIIMRSVTIPPFSVRIFAVSL